MWKCQIHQPRYLVDFHPCISTPRSRYIFQIANNIVYSLIFNIASYGQLHTLPTPAPIPKTNAYYYEKKIYLIKNRIID